MKGFLILILSVCFTITSIGQIDSGFTNKAEAKNLMINGVREGKWFEYLDSNDRKTADTNAPYYVLVNFKDDKPSGIVRQYYRNGKIYWVAYYIDGVQNGIAKQYYQNGQIMFIYPFKNGKQEGLVYEYYESGELKALAPYADDKLNGTQKSYYKNGK